MWFNQDNGPPGRRPSRPPGPDQRRRPGPARQGAHRRATASRAPTFAALPPVACPGNSVAATLPTHDLDKAKQLLDAPAGRSAPAAFAIEGRQAARGDVRLQLRAGRSAASAAAELASATWKQLGVDVTVKAQDSTAISGTVFSTGNWDIVLAAAERQQPGPDRPVHVRPGAGQGHELRAHQQLRLQFAGGQGLGDERQRGLPGLAEGRRPSS